MDYRNIRIGLDIDDVLADFMGAYKKKYKADKNPKVLESEMITKNVYKMRYNKSFWEGLPVLNSLDFIPELYCTKRTNCKSYTKNWLINNDFPDKPVYQMVNYMGNKADMIKGRVDLFIDDSVANVQKCLRSGLPALIYDTPYNQTEEPLFRIYSLDKHEIMEAYKILTTYDYKNIILA